jgi:CHAT domain-containing protein/tetratricopeptide (TPR) repeat protein
MDEPERGMPFLQQAIEIWMKLGERHPNTATGLDNAAEVYRTMGKVDLAEPLYLRALDIRRAVLGDEHPSTATSLNNLALLYHLTGRLEQALPLLTRSLEIRRRALGEHHPDTAVSLSNLALLHVYMGKDGLAAPLLRDALRILRRHLDLTAAVQSERQQLWMVAKLRLDLDAWLALAPRIGVADAEQYAEVVSWKGAVYAIQAGARLELETPEAVRLFDEWGRVSRELATLAWRIPAPEERDEQMRRLAELSDRSEDLERELAQLSAGFRRRRTPVGPADLQRSLPEGTALVDLVTYAYFEPTAVPNGSTPNAPAKGSELRLAAFVLRPDRVVKRVELGALETVETALASWRGSLRGRFPPAGPDPAARVGRLLWSPLQPHLQGVGTVLISPDGYSSLVPWAALPGSKPGTYLIEERRIAVVPVPRLLPEWSAEELAPATSASSRPSLLLVGDVDYGGSPGVAGDRALTRFAGRSGRQPRDFSRLDHTSEEINQVQELFREQLPAGKIERLTAGGATESAFRQYAPVHRWIHLATHGFFAPEEVPSLLDVRPESLLASLFDQGGNVGFHPGLLSGVALSGANTAPKLGEDDGILTAVEVAALDLRQADMVVLSACDTSLGAAASREGVLGLQRAFQISGARTTVTSLWSVDDLATRKLMERFYFNLLEHKKSKLDALQEAQIWMLRQAAAEIRGGVRGNELLYQSRADPDGRLPPYYWAAFVLSGGWQ